MQKVAKRLGALFFALALVVSMLVIPEKAEAAYQVVRSTAQEIDARLPIVTFAMPRSQAERVRSCDGKNWISSRYDKIVLTDIYYGGDWAEVYVKFWNDDKNEPDGNWFDLEDIIGMGAWDRQQRYGGGTYTNLNWDDITTYRTYGGRISNVGYISFLDDYVVLGEQSMKVNGHYYHPTIYPLDESRSLYGVNNIQNYLALCW